MSFALCFLLAGVPARVDGLLMTLQVEAEEEPLHVDAVIISAAAAQSLKDSWGRRGKARSLYPSADAFLVLVQQVLSRDIRSLHQRTHAQQIQQRGDSSHTQQTQISSTDALAAPEQPDASQPAASSSTAQVDAPVPCGRYRVVLDGVDVTYDVDAAGKVVVLGAGSSWSWATVGT